MPILTNVVRCYPSTESATFPLTSFSADVDHVCSKFYELSSHYCIGNYGDGGIIRRQLSIIAFDLFSAKLPLQSVMDLRQWIRYDVGVALTPIRLCGNSCAVSTVASTS
jgi:hypothetical protein